MFGRLVLGSTLLACAAGVLLDVSPAFAYCRQRSCQDDEETGKECLTDEHGCIIEGNTLFYASPCLSFAVASGQAEALGLSDEQFEAIVTNAFARWKNVQCPGGGNPSFEIQSAGILDVSERFFCGVVDLNVSVWMMSTAWPHEAEALGYTTSTYAEDDAEVFDADVELNLRKILDELPLDSADDVMLSIITHEAGHFLGLAHSDDPNAVMYARYGRRDLLSRDFNQDDVKGICEVFPPVDEPVVCSAPGVSEAAIDEAACEDAKKPPGDDGCSVAAAGAPPGRGVGAAGFGLLLALGLVRRRRPSS